MIFQCSYEHNFQKGTVEQQDPSWDEDGVGGGGSL